MLIGCRHKKPVLPEQAYESIEQHFIAGDLGQADAASQRTASQTTDPVWAARFRIQHGRIVVYQGRYQDALTLLNPPLPTGLPDSALAITRGTLLSIALRRSGKLERASQALLDAERLCPNELSCGEVRLAQGIVEIEGAHLDEAVRFFQPGLLSARTRGDRFLEMQFLLNLGVVALRQEHYDEALQRFAAASVLANALGARLALEKSTGNVGWALYKLGDYRRALANSQLAGTQAAALGAPVDEVRWLNDAGLSQYRLGDLNAARSSYQQSLQLSRSIHNMEETGDALIALAAVSLQTGDLDAALHRSTEARQIAEQRGNLVDTLRPALIEALVLQKRGSIAQARDRLIELQRRSAAKLSIRWEAENALARLAAQTGQSTLADLWFQRAIATYRAQRASVADVSLRLPFVENGAGLYLSYMQHLIDQGRTGEALTVFDQGRAATLSETIQPITQPHHAEGLSKDTQKPTVRPQVIAKNLGATILIYSLQPGTSYLWAITPNRTEFLRLPGKEVILPLVDRLQRSLLQSTDLLAQPDSPAYTLFQLLIEPARSLIKSGGKVFIIADEGMNSLNFETLLTSATQPHFWIEEVTIINARSLGLLGGTHKLLSTPAPSKRLLLIGDPIYSHGEYEALPHAREETDSIASYFPQRAVHTGAEATPASYQVSHPASYSYIHFVAHATASADSPLDAAVVLSPPPENQDAYKLYAREVLKEKLNADLVTISSCYGSGVQSYAGEGLVGLTWAFLRAGSHNVIAALWQVNDSSTPRLMNDLYFGLAHGSDPADALRSAKLNMIRGGGVFRKPFYWAPFQLYAGS